MTVLACLLAAGSTAPFLFGQDSAVRVQRLADCEKLDGWRPPAKLAPGATRGKFCVTRQAPPGMGALVFHHGDSGIDLSKAQALIFWWKAQGVGLESFMVKVRNYPLARGMEAVYVVWKPSRGPMPEQWRREVVPLSKPDYDNWGGKPSRDARYICFRTQSSQDANVRLFIDDVVALPPTVDWQMGPTEFAKGQWFAPLSYRNRTEQALTLRVRPGKGRRLNLRARPGLQRTYKVPLPVSRKKYRQLDPLGTLKIPVEVEVANIPATKTAAIVKVTKPLPLPRHPRLMFDQAGIARLRQRISEMSWAKDRWASVLRRAERAAEKPVVLPPRGGNWWHYFSCPKHGARLRRGKQTGEWQWQYTCAAGKEIVKSDPDKVSRDYDGVTITGIHASWARSVLDLGLAFQVTGKKAYAVKAREILLAYAAKYLSYPLHDTRGRERTGGGRTGAQTLTEATWLIPLVQGADLVWQILSEKDRKAIAEGCLLPAARDVILKQKMGVHNIQCWKNSAVGLVGFLLNDQDLVREAIQNPDRGYRRQMAEGVMDDGIWWEESWGYHFYTLMALWPLTEAARNCGLDLYGPEMKSMYDAPFKFAQPNLRLPAFNDSGEVNLRGQSSLYELAYARYGNPACLSLLDRKKRNLFGLWFGADELPEAPPQKFAAVNYPKSGYAILSKGAGPEGTWLAFKYGPHGGGHGHPDKLSFILYSRGRILGLDPGSTHYGIPVHAGWYKTTLAHNTLVVDETSQAPAEGRCLAFGEGSNRAAFAMAEAGPIYKGVRFVRTVALLDQDLVLFIDQIRCEKPHQLDVVYHQRGEWKDLPDGKEWSPPNKVGYRYLESTTVRTAEKELLLSTHIEGTFEPVIHFLGSGPAEIITGTGIGHHVKDRVPAVIFRTRGKATASAWCVALDGRGLSLKWLNVRDDRGNPVSQSRAAALVLQDDQGHKWQVLANPDELSLRIDRPGQTSWTTRERVVIQ